LPAAPFLVSGLASRLDLARRSRARRNAHARDLIEARDRPRAQCHGWTL